MEIGPVEILVIGFPGNQFNGDVAPALAELVQTGLIRVIDLVFVLKDADGNVVGVELSDLPEPINKSVTAHVEEPNGMLAEEDIEDLAADLPANSSAALLLIEHLWATRFRDALVNSGGELIRRSGFPKK